MTWLNLFGGPGGFCLGARECGGDPLGIEIDGDVCATRRAAGLPTLERDVASLDPAGFIDCDVMLASPPCPSFSQANDDRPTEDLGLVLRPRTLVCEQVPPVLPVWRHFAAHLEAAGYSTWTGILEAERYGVPQTRERAFLLASLDVDVHPPPPTNQRYVPGHAPQHELTFDGELKPWVSMAQALGWDPRDRVGFARQADELAATADGYRERDFRPAGVPAFTLTEKARSWQRRPWASAAVLRVMLDEAAVLQGFPRGYPWHGNMTKRFGQVGDAVPPALAAAAIRAAIGDRHGELQRQTREILQHERERAAA